METKVKKSKWDGLIVGEMPLTGPVNIDVDFLTKHWDIKCFLAEWRSGDPKTENFRFIRYRRLGQQTTSHKFTITKETAHQLIEKLDLVEERSIFNSAYSWRTPNQLPS